MNFEYLEKIVLNFDIDLNLKNICSLGSGHINDSYLVRFEDNTKFVLQRINHEVFANVDELMSNYVEICNYFNENRKLKPSSQYKIQVVPSNGNYWYLDANNQYWRMISYIEGSKSYDLIPSVDYVLNAGKGYGQFMCSLNSFPANKLNTTIQDFHNLKVRLLQLNNAIKINYKDRINSVGTELDLILKYKREALAMQEVIELGDLPVRVTHNDTKLNNILFNQLGEADCVIDLDTIMPGCLLYDFGDAIRTSANTALEDEKNLDVVGFNLEYFKAFTKGFLSEMRNEITNKELDLLISSISYMPLIMAVRFLSDYLNGDLYYKTEYADHNLTRAKVQLRFLEKIEAQKSQLVSFVDELHYKMNK